jgi:hypothetical protein
MTRRIDLDLSPASIDWINEKIAINRFHSVSDAINHIINQARMQEPNEVFENLNKINSKDKGSVIIK